MARRSAQNPRYQRDAKVGSTRRSAASAKPKREAGESGGSGGKGSSAKKSSAKVPFEPDTPEFRRWRKIWLGLLVAAIVFSIGAWYARDTPSGTLGLVFAYSTLFSALYIDLTKIRRMRKEWREQMAKGGKKKSSASGSKTKAAKSESSDAGSDSAEGSADDVVKPVPTVGDKIKGMFGGKKGDA